MEAMIGELKNRLKSLPDEARDSLFQYLDNGCEDDPDFPDADEVERRRIEVLAGKAEGIPVDQFIREFESRKK